VTGFSSSKDELVASLQAYTTLLAAKNEALLRLSSTTAEVRSTLRDADSPDISDALRRRDREIASYSALCGNSGQDESIVNAALAAANAANDELNVIARSVIAMREDSRALAEEVLSCQSECETLLKSRLAATSKALHRSTQRRKLDAAYGPAINHDTPTFMDKQR
jgi:hypothetical protein